MTRGQAPILSALRASFATALAIALVQAFSAAWAANRWPDERTAGPFVCHADFSLKPYETLLSELMQLQDDVTRELGIPANRETIHVYLFAKPATYKKYLAHYFPQAPTRRALFVKERGPGMVFAYRSDELAIDIRHEGTHALLHAVLPMVPLWLDEGLAEYFEVPPEDRAYGNPHLAEIRRTLWLKGTPRLEQLEQLQRLEEMGSAQYRDAWAWVHFMLHGPPEAREELTGTLRSIAALSPPGNLSERLRRRMPDLEQRFTTHFYNWKR
jgi:hypothetical protein